MLRKLIDRIFWKHSPSQVANRRFREVAKVFYVGFEEGMNSNNEKLR